MSLKFYSSDKSNGENFDSGGLGCVIVGLVMQFAPQAFSCLGNYRGYPHEKGNMKFFPISTMILVVLELVCF